MLDDESYHIIKGAVEAPEGIQVNMIIDGVLWRPGQIVNDSILDREHFLATMPISNPMKSRKGGWVNGLALCPAATSLARYSAMNSGCSKVEFQLSKIMLVLSSLKPMSMPCSMPLSSLLHHAWSG